MAVAGGPADPDRRLVKDSFAHIAANPQSAMEYLYARLFTQCPQLRGLFPMSMEQTSVTTFSMLARLVASLSDRQATEHLLADLGRTHRKFGVRDKHYQPFFDALLATAERCAGLAWTAQLRQAWESVLAHFATAMSAAAALDEKEHPAWWLGEIVKHDLRTTSIAVITIKPDPPLDYRAGQYLSVQAPRWPRAWRDYSIGNAPRGSSLLDIHVRAVPGGMVSTALVSHCRAGDTIMLGPARGDLALPGDPHKDMVCVAGGTGLAPIKALVEAVVAARTAGRRRAVTVYFGARHSGDLYDLSDLESLRLAYPALAVIPVVESELEFDGRLGRLPEVAAAHPSFRDTEVYISGPPGMISATLRALRNRVPADRLHHDSLSAMRAARRPVRWSRRD